MGANIGTTVGSQIIAFEIYRICPHRPRRRPGPPPRRQDCDTARSLGSIALGFGLLFLGLDALGDAVAPHGRRRRLDGLAGQLGRAAHHRDARRLRSSLSSSSRRRPRWGRRSCWRPRASSHSRPGWPSCWGRRSGRCPTRSSRRSGGRGRRSGRPSSTSSIAWSRRLLGLASIGLLTELARWLTPDGTTARHIANAHVAFNVIGVALFLPFIGPISRFLLRVLPPRPADTRQPPGAPPRGSRR